MSAEIKNIIESVIFASEEEIAPKQLKEVLDSFEFKVSTNDIEDYIADLNKDYHDSQRAFKIIKIAGGYQFSTKQEYAKFIGKLFTERQKKKLSPSALETLAIVAYKQPITRSDIEFIRGVNVDYIVNALLERELINIVGRANTPGRPILYGTTKNFLKTIGLGSLDELPKLKEINDILKNEKLEGITEADIDLFNSINNPSQDEQQMDFEGSSEEESDVESDEVIDEIIDEDTNEDLDKETTEEETEDTIHIEDDEDTDTQDDELLSRDED